MPCRRGDPLVALARVRELERERAGRQHPYDAVAPARAVDVSAGVSREQPVDLRPLGCEPLGRCLVAGTVDVDHEEPHDDRLAAICEQRERAAVESVRVCRLVVRREVRVPVDGDRARVAKADVTGSAGIGAVRRPALRVSIRHGHVERPLFRTSSSCYVLFRWLPLRLARDSPGAAVAPAASSFSVTTHPAFRIDASHVSMSARA